MKMANEVKNPLLSVVIPAYNVEEYVDACLDSVVSQTYSNLEIIIVNDGSTDDTGAKCDAWAAKDDRIRVIHTDNFGVCTARNKGLDEAKGDFFALVDSDDYLNPDMFGVLMKKAKTSDADIVVCGYKVQMPAGEELDECDFAEEKTFNESEIIGLSQDVLRHKGNICNKLEIMQRAVYRRDKINARFRIELSRLNEDYFYQIEALLCAKKVVFIPDVLYYYRYNSVGRSKVFDFNKFLGFPVLVRELNKLYESRGLYHIGDYAMMMIAFNTVQRLFSSDLNSKEIRNYLCEMTSLPVWNDIKIDSSIMSMQEKVIYFAMKHNAPIFLYCIMRMNYAFRPKKVF